MMMDGMPGGGAGTGLNLYMMMFLNGLSQASHIFLLALGLSLIFGVMRILNLAHGALHIFGVYAALTFIAWGAGWWVALLLGPLAVAAVGALMEVTLLRPMYRRHPTYVLILTFGAILVFYDLFRLGWGVTYQLLPEPRLVGGATRVLGMVYPTFYLFSIAVAVVLGLLLWALLDLTRFGRTIRAAAEDREMAAAVGINVPLVYTAVFALGTFITALGGVLMGTIMAISPAESFHTMLHAFAIVVIGGLGSLTGAALGAFLVGQVNAFGLLIAPEWEIAFMFLLMATVLVLRPHGLLGRELR